MFVGRPHCTTPLENRPPGVARLRRSLRGFADPGDTVIVWPVVACRQPGIVFGLVVCLGACGKSSPKELPPYGEVVIAIDTDAPVPEFASRLRLDLFDASGTWFESRDVGMPSRGDWPATFSVYSTDEQRPRTVLVRLRAYLEGRTRDYRGERYLARPPYTEPHSAQSLDELCTNMPTLALGPELTLRRGSKTVTTYIPDQRPANAPAGWMPTCGYPVVGGAVAARLMIAAEGDYRIATTRVDPITSINVDTNLFIRTNCRDPTTQIACADDSSPDKPGLYASSTTALSDLLASATIHLKPGSYAVIAAGYYAEAVDVTLRADLLANWDQSPSSVPAVEPSGTLPRLMSAGTDATPAEEPQPLVTIDRLARIDIAPGMKKVASIVLRTVCAGWMAKLSAGANNAAPVLQEAQTCVDTEGKLVPVHAEALSPWTGVAPTASVGELRFGETCPAGANDVSAVCIPGGTLVLGSPQGASSQPTSSLPERFALVNRFWFDKTEVTVGRWRAAMQAGFRSPDETPFPNDQLLITTNKDLSPLLAKLACTFSSSPSPAGQPREDFPLNCVSWAAARAFCQAHGGDLPTEAQWEYAAAKAGRPFKTGYPWGDQDQAPPCNQAVFARIGPNGPVASRTCLGSGKPYGPAAVTDPDALNDITVLGVRDLGGNVAEWALDSFYPYDSPCWTAATLTDPVCWENDATARAARGGSFENSAVVMSPWNHIRHDQLGDMDEPLRVVGHNSVGFRCVFREQPK